MAIRALIGPQDRVPRKTRSPKHTFQLRTRPFQLSPFMIAPVLPGETLTDFVLQSRAYTDPIDNSCVGWTKEYYLFYVKHRDLYDRDKIVAMHLNPNEDMSSLDSATSLAYYHTNGTELAINWPLLCMERVVDEYFRFEGEAMADYVIATVAGGNLPAVPVGRNLFIDSLTNEDAIIGSSFDEDLASASAGQGNAATTVMTSEIVDALRRYELARAQNITEMTFEDYLETFGIKVPGSEELHKPELIRVVREWQYPSNTIDPTNGTPRAAVSWAIQDRGKKNFFFDEPGFVFGVTCTRPKVYYENLTSNAVMLMNTAKDWLPAVLSDDPAASLKLVNTAGDPPVDANTDKYVIDIKDIFIHGDQFVNFALTDGNANLVALPLATGVHRYLVTDAELDGLFVGASPANQIREDGVCQLHIKSPLRDTTPNVIGTNTTV